MMNLVLGIILTVFAVSTLAPSTASALVMCAKVRKATGEIREGTSIKLRTTCRDSEEQLNPAALGLQGPPGEDGGGIVARDATGVLLGPTGELRSREVAVTSTVVDGISRPVVVAFTAPGFSGERSFYYESSDCVGEALFLNANTYPAIGDLRVTGPASQGEPHSGPGTLLHYPVGGRFTTTALSIGRDDNASGCAGEGGVFTSPSFCCISANVTASDYHRTATFDLGNFVPPLRVAVR